MIVSRSDCGLLPPVRQPAAMLSQQGWVVHWVGSSDMVDRPTLDHSKATWRSIQQEAFNRGFDDVFYNFATDGSGNILEGRGWPYANGANGTTDSNYHLYSVCSLSGPGSIFTDEEKAALIWLCQEGARRYSTIRTVQSHRSVPGVSTGCPGDERANFCPTIQARLWDAPAPVPQPIPGPQPVPAPRRRDMLFFYKVTDNAAVSPNSIFISDGFVTRHIGNPAELGVLQFIAATQNVPNATTVGSLPYAVHVTLKAA